MGECCTTQMSLKGDSLTNSKDNPENSEDAATCRVGSPAGGVRVSVLWTGTGVAPWRSPGCRLTLETT